RSSDIFIVLSSHHIGGQSADFIKNLPPKHYRTKADAVVPFAIAFDNVVIVADQIGFLGLLNICCERFVVCTHQVIVVVHQKKPNLLLNSLRMADVIRVMVGYKLTLSKKISY